MMVSGRLTRRHIRMRRAFVRGLSDTSPSPRYFAALRLPSLRANGSRECAPDDRLHEAIHGSSPFFTSPRLRGELERSSLFLIPPPFSGEGRPQRSGGRGGGDEDVLSRTGPHPTHRIAALTMRHPPHEDGGGMKTQDLSHTLAISPRVREFC